MSNLTYGDTGVDIGKKHGALSGIAGLVRSTFTAGVLHEPGAFGGMFDGRFPNLEEPVLVATNDGVGTKVRLAVRAGRPRGLGLDIVHHVVNDALVQGAEPLFFLDYFAASRLDPEVFQEVIEGIVEACRGVGAALLGGETAEMPGVYAEGEFDLVGFLVGVVDRERRWPAGVAVGDALVALRSDGLHTNGYSLANFLVDQDTVDLAAEAPGCGESWADALLRPHRAYLEPIRRLRDAVTIHGLAHITGGGLQENLPRVLPDDVGAVIDRGTWTPNPVFQALMAAGGIDREEAFRVFNMGCGLVVALPATEAETAVATLAAAGQEAWVVGHLEVGRGVRSIG